MEGGGGICLVEGGESVGRLVIVSIFFKYVLAVVVWLHKQPFDDNGDEVEENMDDLNAENTAAGRAEAGLGPGDKTAAEIAEEERLAREAAEAAAEAARRAALEASMALTVYQLITDAVSISEGVPLDPNRPIGQSAEDEAEAARRAAEAARLAAEEAEADALAALASDLTKPPRYMVGVGGEAYENYKPLPVAQFRKERRALLAAHHAWGGYPTLADVEGSGTLRVAEGGIRVGGTSGTLLVEEGYGYANASQMIAIHTRYVLMDYSSKATWFVHPPTEPQILATTVVPCSLNKRPVLYVYDPVKLPPTSSEICRELLQVIIHASMIEPPPVDPAAIARAAHAVYTVGVAGTDYEGYRMLTMEELRGHAASILAAHKTHNGFPVLTRSLRCNFPLFVAEGPIRIGGNSLAEVGWTGSQVLAGPEQTYEVMNFRTKTPWKLVSPREAELARAKVEPYAPAGYPCLFILTDPL